MYKLGEITHWYCPKCRKGNLTIIGINGNYAICQCSECGNTTKIIIAYGQRKYKKHNLNEVKNRFERLIKNEC